MSISEKADIVKLERKKKNEANKIKAEEEQLKKEEKEQQGEQRPASTGAAST